MDLIEIKSGSFTRHPWELARFFIFSRLLKENGLFNRGPIDILDVGSGDAWFASQLINVLPNGSRITCWDVGYSDRTILKKVRDHAHKDLSFSEQLPQNKFDVLLLLDVLEHVADDHGFLKSLAQNSLPDKGTILISVPAFQTLFSSHDRHLSHLRRYSPSQIKSVLEQSCLHIRHHGAIFSSLLLVRIFEKMREALCLEQRPAELEDWKAGKQWTAVVQRLLQTDGRFGLLISKVGIDFLGLSWWALCEK